MTTQSTATILGIGVHLPDEIRTNDWWPKDVVEGWARARTSKLTEKQSGPRVETPGAALVAEHMSLLRDDPFVGARQRRVLASGAMSSDMETAAGLEALARAGVAAGEIDLLMVSTLFPDRVGMPNAYVVHDRLGLAQGCITLQSDAACNSFLVSLEAATAMIASGAARKALLVQSCCISRTGRVQDPFSAWFGDGATAVVVGAASAGRGVVSRAHRTNSNLYRVFHFGVDGGAWYDQGRTWVQLDDPNVARTIVYGSLDALKEVALEALSKAGLSAFDVQFYGGHPATPFAVEASARYIGLEHARTVNTFPIVANLASANIPMVLAMGEREGLLRDGDLALLAGGGAGGSWSSVVLRWGS